MIKKLFSITKDENYKTVKIFFIKLKFKLSFLQKLEFNNNKIYLNNTKINDNKTLEHILKHIEIMIAGQNNEIFIPNLDCFEASIIAIKGNNNTIDIKPTMYKFRNLHLCIGNNTDNGKVYIGENCSAQNNCYIECMGKNKNITLGNNCMLGSHIIIRTTDYHKLYNLQNNEIINPDEDIQIGSNVWICDSVTILKGSNIPDGCTLGYHSFVNKKFDQANCLLAGTPAKCIKNNIKWER